MNYELLRNIEVERVVLSSAFNSEGLMLIKEYKVQESDFYLEKHQELFKEIMKYYNANGSIDLISLLDESRNNETLNKLGGVSYISGIASEHLTNVTLLKHIEILKDYTLKRYIYEISNFINTNISMESKDLLNKVEEKILEQQHNSDDINTNNINLDRYLTLKEDIYLEKKTNNTIKTGLIKLDNHIEGFSKGELITIFAFSAVGKSTLAGQIALNMAKAKRKVMYFSLELNYNQVMDRFISNLSNMDHKIIRNINKNNITDDDFTKIVTYAMKINNYISIYECTNFDEIISKIQINKIKNNVDIVFIDYIGLIEGVQASDERMKITKITRRLKALSNSLNIPIVILAQANQMAERRNTSAYKIYEKLGDTDIAESASVFRDSDTVIGVYRNTILDDEAARRDMDIDYNSRDATKNPECVNLLIKKCRKSTKKTLSFRWIGKRFRVENYP